MKKKLELNDLKVESFSTSLENKDSQTVKKGGSSPLCDVAVVVVVLTAIYFFLCYHNGCSWDSKP